MEKLHFKITKEELALIKKVAKETRRTMVSFFREALENIIKKYAIQNKKRS